MQVTVMGAGSFGTSLAKLLAENGHPVTLWSHSADTLDAIAKTGENSIYLPGIALPKMNLTQDAQNALQNAELVVTAVPAQATRSVWEKHREHLPKNALVVSASKGIEIGTNALVSDILLEVLGAEYRNKLFFLSGPSFAKEIALRIPTAITIAGWDAARIPDIQKSFHNEYFRVYGTADVNGVELGGALKNVMAIATGISDGLGLGNNSRAAIITRGLAEIARMGKRMGADPMTFMGLAGIGDLVLTCTGDLSRNRSVGIRLGKGEKLKEIVDSMRMVAEGVPTTRSAYELAQRLGIELPIMEGVYSILYEDKPAKTAIIELMSRRLKFEGE